MKNVKPDKFEKDIENNAEQFVSVSEATKQKIEKIIADDN